MRTQYNQAIHYGHGFGFDADRMSFDPERVIEQTKDVVTNQGRTTIRKQLLETVLLVAFVLELIVVFGAMGW